MLNYGHMDLEALYPDGLERKEIGLEMMML